MATYKEMEKIFEKIDDLQHTIQNTQLPNSRKSLIINKLDDVYKKLTQCEPELEK